MIIQTNKKYMIHSSWGKDNKGKSIWKANSASEAGERHRVAFPAEQIEKIEKCDQAHSKSDFDLLSSIH